MAKKITETGPIGLRGIRNSDLYSRLSSAAQNGDADATNILTGLSIGKSRAFGPGSNAENYFVPQQFDTRTPYATLGDSQYDTPYIIGSDPAEVNEQRYENQPWYDVLANGIGKMYGTAATTFLSSVVGLPYGAIQAAAQVDFAAIWDNSVTQALSGIDEWMENNMTNYKSQQQQDSPWYSPSNLFSMNFLADDVIKNYGFTMGAAASMLVGSGELGLLSKAIGWTGKVGKGTKMANNFLSALFSATGEGMIEAKQGVEERDRAELQKLDKEFVPLYNNLNQQRNEIDQLYAATGDYDTYMKQLQDWNLQKQTIDKRKAAGEQQIYESGKEMGNMILLANQALLTAGNLIQFSKGMTRGFDFARHVAETTNKAVKPALTTATRVGADIAKGYKISSPWPGRILAGTKGFLTEGSEEMNQQWIQFSSGAAYNEEDVNDYWRAKKDSDSYRDTTEGLYTMGNILSKGFKDSWGDVNQWQQFVVGALTGLAGSYAPTRIFNQDKTKSVFNPMRYGTWEGGAVNKVRDFNNEYRQYRENIDDLNKVLQSEGFPERVASMVGHTYTEKQKTKAAEEGDKKAYKDAEDKQTIHDIQAFLRAGKLDDLKAIYEEMGKTLSDEDVQNIVKSTTKEISKEEDKQNFDRSIDEQIAAEQQEVDALYSELEGLQNSLLGSTPDAYDTNRDYVINQQQDILNKIEKGEQAIADLNQQKETYGGQKYFIGPYVDREGNVTISDDQIKEVVKHNSEEMTRKLNSYLDSINEVNKMTNGNLTKEQEDNLVYLHNISKEKVERVNKIMQNVRKQLPSKFLLKTNATPEQLAKQFASSDLAFSKDENTKDGYVEVDTSFINDKVFAAFFLDNIIGGQNISAKTEEEGQKKSEEQLRTNESIIRQAFVDNAMQKNGKTLQEALASQEYDDLIDGINDAASLYAESKQFYNTYLDYMLNPAKVEQAKAKEEKKQEDKAKKEKVDGASMDEMLGMSDIDLGAILSAGKKGKNKAGNKARKALGMKNGRQKAKKELDAAVKASILDEETASDAMKLLDEQISRMTQEDDFDEMDSMRAVVAKMMDVETEAMNDPEVLLSEQDRNALEDGIEIDEAAYEERLSKAKDALSSITDTLEKELQEIEDAVDKDVLNKALDDTDNTSKKADAAVAKSKEDDTTKNNASPVSNTKRRADAAEPMKPVTTVLKSKKEKQENPVTYSGESSVLDSDREQGQSGNNIPESEKPSWHPWMSSTSEVGQYTNQPYEPSPSDPHAAFKKERYDVIKKKLEEEGAYTRRKNGKIIEGMKVGFKVFQDVNNEAGDFVIFITDELGNIIGDLPSNDSRLATSRRDVPMDAIYDEIQKEWEDTDEDERKSGMKSKLTSVVDHVLVGKVRYLDGRRQTVAQLFNGSEKPILFAVKTDTSVATNSLHTNGVNAREILYPRTGRVGQPYVLIQTPGMHESQNGFKYYAVPVSTKTIGELGSDTAYMRVLTELLRRIKYGASTSITDIEAKKLLQSLLAVANVHVNLSENSDTKKGLGIRVTAVDPSTRQLIPVEIHTGTREEMDIAAILGKLSGIRANFSLDFINNADSKQLKALLTIEGQSIGNYNDMMAEIAETNAAEPQTVNDWFTIRPLERKGDNIVMVEQKDTLPKWTAAESGKLQVPVKIKGKASQTWTVDIADGYRVFDERGTEIVPTKENGSKHTEKEKAMAKIVAAEAFGAAHNKNADEPFAVTLWGQTQIYDPKKQRFSKKKDIQTILKEAEAEGRTLTEEEKYEVVNSYLENVVAAQEESKKEDTREAIAANAFLQLVKIGVMEEDASHYHLVKWNEEQQEYVPDPEGDYYQDDRDQSIHARVSNINDADIEVIEANKKAKFGKVNPQLKTASTGARNVVARVVRDFFAGRVGTYPNINSKDLKKLTDALQKIKQQLNSNGWEINSTGMVASGIVSFDGETSVNVAGTIDLLAYNLETGKYAIIDMETSLAALFDKDGKIKSDPKTKAKIAHWIAQQTLYKNFLEKKYDIEIEGLRIMPFGVDYSIKFNETDYQQENGVLKDKGIVVDIHPSYMGKMISLTPKTDVKYKTAQLPESVKRLLPKSSITKAPTDEKIAVKEQLITLRDRVPQGSSLKDFISKEYKDDPEVQKLVDNLEENKGSNAPVMMTKASQDLLLEAIDKNALEKAAQEAAAAEQQLKIDIPENDTQESMKEASELLASYGIHSQELEELKELPQKLFIQMSKNKMTALGAFDMLIDGASIEEIGRYIQSSSQATRHKKATKENYTRLNLPQELRWMTKNLPQISRERKLQIVKGLIACSDGTMDFGRVENGIITIGTQAEEGTVYHEAFHYVLQFLMTDAEISKLAKAARERYGNMPSVALEERLADDFADYVKGLDPEDSSIKRFFRELWNTIKALFSKKSYIETLFRDINNGVYSGREFRDDRDNEFLFIQDEQREVAKNYEYLSEEERERLQDAQVPQTLYNSMTKEQQEYMLHCVV